MDRQEYIQFAKENPVCFFATEDGDQPHVRSLILERADETGFYFALINTKKMYKQVCANPRVEICFFHGSQDFGEIKQMRITGIFEEIHDPEMLEKAYASRKGLEANVGKSIKPMLAIFRMNKGDAHFWMMKDALLEDKIEILHF